MSSSTSSSKPNNDGGTSLAASNEDGETPSAPAAAVTARSAANKNRLSANLCQKRPHKNAANNNEEDENNSSSYADMDSFSLHLPITNNNPSNRNSSSHHHHRHSQRSSDDSSDDTSTSDVTWLTYRDEKCNEVKEEFMKRLKIETKNKQQLEQQSGNTNNNNNNNNNNKRNSNMLSVEERRMLLENIVRELGRREEVEKERRKREERDGKKMNNSDGEGDGKKGRIMVEEEEESEGDDYLTEEEVEDDDSDDEEGEGEGAGGTHPAALFDSIGNFRASPGGGGAGTGGGGGGDPPSSSSFHYHDPQLLSSGGGHCTITMGGLDLVKEETRSDIRAAGGSTRSYQSSSQKTPSSQGDSYNNNINNTTTTTDQQLQQIIHQDHINSIVNLKLLVANQQTIIDALASKLHQAELSNNILQSENKILNKNNEMQQQQLIQKTREVMEMKREQQEQRRRLTTTTSVTTSDVAPSVLSSSLAAGAAAAATGGAKTTTTTTTKNNMSQEQFTIRALESKLQQMDQMNKLLVQENTQLQMSLIREKSKGGGGTGTTANDDTTVDDGLKDSVEQQKEEVEGEGVVEREGEDAVVETKVEGEVVPSLPLPEEEQPRVEDVPPPEGEVKVAPSLLPEEEEQPREEEVPPPKEVVTDSIPSSSGPSLDFLRNKLMLKSQAASERSSSSGKASVEITKNNARKTTRFADQQDRYSKTVSGVPPRKYGQEVSSSDSGTGPVVEPIRYKSQIASSNRLLGDTKLRNFSGLANRLGISRLNSTGRLNSIMRVEDLSKELIPIVGEPKFCAMIYNVLTPEECTALIRRAKAEQFEELSYYRRGSMKGTPSNISCCKRCRLGDSDLAVSLLQKILLALKGTPLEQAFQRRPSSEGDDEDKGHARAVLTRISEPFNVIRYDVGEFFAPHRDTTFRTGTEVSRLTLQVFLNEKFNGGTTSIRQGKEYYDIKAKAGSVLLFDQDLRREECYVVSGKKYVLRADIMYDESKADVVDGATAVTESAYTRESGYTRETSNPAA